MRSVPCLLFLLPILLHGCATPQTEVAPPHVGVTTWQEASPEFTQDCPDNARQGEARCGPWTAEWQELYDPFFAQPQVADAAEPVDDCASLPADLWAIREAGDSWSEPLEWADVGGPAGLGESAWRATGMDFLIDSLPERDMEVFVLSTMPLLSPNGVPYDELSLVIRDRFAGDVPALLLLPRGDDVVPAVVAMPGHAEDAGFHVDTRFGSRFPERGLALLTVSFRAYQQGDGPATTHPETNAAMRFLCLGMNLMTMRAYEAVLAVRAAAAHPRLDGGRIGVIGHSGGSTAAHLLVWREDVPVNTWVLDNGPAHFDLDQREPGDPATITVDCGVHEWLDGATQLLADVCSVPGEWGREILRVPYAYSTQAAPYDNSDDCTVWPWENAGELEPEPTDGEAPELFLPFFVQRLSATAP